MGKMKPFHFLAKNCSTTRGPITQHLNQNSRANASDFTRSPISINEYGCQSIIPKILDDAHSPICAAFDNAHSLISNFVEGALPEFSPKPTASLKEVNLLFQVLLPKSNP